MKTLFPWPSPWLLSAALAALAAAAAAQETEAWLRDLGGADELQRETARRHLTLQGAVPADRLVALLKAEDPAVVVAAALVLRAHGAGVAELSRLWKHADDEVRRTVLPVVTDIALAEVFDRDSSQAVRIAALRELEDRGRLTDELLLRALRSELPDLADAATRLMVFERAPFPLGIADKLLELPAARHRLIAWLADRPRARSGPWLLKVLKTPMLDELDYLLAISSLPPDWLDLEHGRAMLAAAVSERVALSNRAALAAGRLPHEVADRLAEEVVALVEGGKPADRLLPCLARVTGAGEQALFEFSLRAGDEVRKDISLWLSARGSALIDQHVVRSLDGRGPFPPELVALTSKHLDKPGRIAKVAAVLGLGGRPGSEAFDALLEADVFRPEMEAYAADGMGPDLARRYYRLFQLPPDRLPLAVLRRALESDDATVKVAAVHALARAKIDPSLEPLLLDFALRSKVPTLELAASRALVLQGSEAAGRQVWQAGSGGESTLQWLIEKPKPWSHEFLLKRREALAPARKDDMAGYQRVLIALAQLGDRGANEELLDEIPSMAPAEIREAKKLLGRFFKPAELEAMARRYLAAKAGEAAEADEDSRVQLLEWFLGRKDLDLDAVLQDLWRKDGSYEVRLVALRGLLNRDSPSLHGSLERRLRERWGEDLQELAFEVIGSMAHPLSEKAQKLLAHIVLVAPLTDPAREIQLSYEQGYDSVRGAYPLITPAANLLRRDGEVEPRAAFEAVAGEIGDRRYALNRQRLGLLLAGIQLNGRLARALGPLLARLIVEAPDRSPDFLGPAHMILADAARAAGEHAKAAELYEAATRAFCRDAVPHHVRRAFFGDIDPVAGYHPYAALAAQAPLARARIAFAEGRTRDGHRLLGQAHDLAEGDRATIKEIDGLRRAQRK